MVVLWGDIAVDWERVLCITIAIAIWLVVTKMFMRRTSSTQGNIPPGSLGFPLIGETLDFMAANCSNKGLYDFVHARRLRYGGCFKTSIYRRTHVFMSSIKSAKAILMSNDEINFSKSYMRSIEELVGKDSLLCASPQGHHRLLRGRLSALFTTDAVSLFVRNFDHLVLTTLSHWENSGTVVVLHDALSITFKAMCKMLMSLEDPGDLETLQKDVTQVCEAMVAIPLKLPHTRFYKGVKARRRIMETLRKMMDRRRKDLEEHEDFMQTLLVGEESSSDSASPLTDTQIRDNILTMIIAGQETTANAMTWMVKYLDENQQVQETLRAEQLQLTSKALPGSLLTLEDLNEMPYASKVVRESLRTASVVSWFPRVALNDCEVEGYKIKKGWIVNIDARSIHLDPTVYHDPNKFYPSRFDDESKPYSFLAFGMGGRTCLGMNLAKAMILVFLHRLVTMYRWKVMDPDPSLEKWALFARLKSGCSVSVMRMPPNTHSPTHNI